MNIFELLELLHKKGIRVLVEDGGLKIDAPEGVMTNEVFSLLKQNKKELIDYLEATKESGVLIEKIDRSQPIPLSFSQERLWFIDRLEGGSSNYNLSGALEVEGKFDIDAAEESFRRIISRHETLRTVITEAEGDEEGALQQIRNDFEFSLKVSDLRGIEGKSKEKLVAEAIREDAMKPFDLTRDLMLRVSYLRLEGSEESDQKGVLIFNLHHIAADAWSWGILIDEFQTNYQSIVKGVENPLAPLEIQYADYSAWQRVWATGDSLEKQFDYWQKKLNDLPFVHSLPLDKERPAFQKFLGAHHKFGVSRTTLERLKQLAVRENMTMFMVIHAAFAWTLSRYAGTNDIVIGSPIANRPQKELEPLIGFFVNTLVLRTNSAGESTVHDYLQETKRTILEAQSNQDVPFEQLVDRVNPQRSTAHNALFQIMFSMNTTENEVLVLPGLRLTPIANDGDQVVAKFDLTLNAQEVDNELELIFEYNTDLFDRESIERLSESLELVVESLASLEMTTVPMGEIQVLNENETHRLINGLNPKPTDYPIEKTIHQLFEEQVEKTPDNTAVVFENESLTYRELNEAANRIAHNLTEKGVKPDQIVGLCVGRSIEMMVGLLGILKAGAAYLPLDPKYPHDRLRNIIENADIDAIIFHSHFQNLTKGIAFKLMIDDPGVKNKLKDYSNNNPSIVGLTSNNLAYVIYTSGSTGIPKGILIEHKSATNLAVFSRGKLGLSEKSKVLQYATLNFDAATWEWMMALHCGAELCICAEETRKDTDRLSDYLVETGITHALIPPAVLRELEIERKYGFDSLIVGGEAFEEALSRKWGSRYRLFNAYGPSETTVVATMSDQITDQRLNIGNAISNLSALVLDDDLRIVPFGSIGELYIGGAGLARGYLKRDELTREKFKDNPYGEGRLYKTGDLVRYLREGNLEFVGRADHQVKVRGFRIELGEIEHELTKIEEIRSAVVVAKEDEPGQKRLVGYAAVGRQFAEEENSNGLKAKIKERLSVRLPEYMVPSVIVLMEDMPVTPNGKTDRKNLPEPEAGAVGEVVEPPRGKTEEILAGIWSTLLKIPESDISRTANFFELGGNSLSSVRLANMIKTQFGAPIQIKDVFEHMSLSAQAEFIGSASNSIQILELLDLLHQDQIKVSSEKGVLKIDAPEGLMTGEILGLLKSNKKDLIEYLESTEKRETLIKIVDRDNKIPLSYAQQRLWFIDRMDGASGHYNMPGALKVSGCFDSDAADEAFQRIVKRHESLRTVFREAEEGEEGAVQFIREDVDFALKVTDLRHLSEDEQKEYVSNAAHEDANYAFDLSCDVFLRAAYLLLAGQQGGDQEGVLLFNMHHIASDGWSFSILVDEFAKLYESITKGETADPLEPLKIQYADYAAWQREWLQGEVLEKQLDYWERQLAELPQVHSLPLDKERPAFQTFSGSLHSFRINGDVLKRLKTLALDEQATLFMVLHAAFSWTLSRFSGTNDVVIGTPVANRLQKELEPLIGFFVNTLVLRTDQPGSKTVSEYLKEIKRVNLEAQSNQDVPFEHLVDRVNPARSTAHNALFQIMFSMNTNEGDELKLPGVSLTPIEDEAADVVSKFDLTLNAMEEADGLELSIEYNTDLFERETIERIGGSLTRVIEGLAAAKTSDTLMSAIPVISEEERRYLLEELNDTAAEYPQEKLIHQLFEEEVLKTPDKSAVVCGNKTLSYKELNEASNQIAHFLNENGTKPGQTVGLCVERSPEMIIGLMGILKAGAAYLALDPNYPKNRLEYMMEDADVKTVITQTHLTGFETGDSQTLVIDDAQTREQIENAPHHNPKIDGLTSENLAYLIYTSGSTGKPKGVMIEHRNTVAMISWAMSVYDRTQLRSVLASTSLSFDISVFEVFVPLAAGTQVVIVDNILALRTLRPDISLINTVPSAGRMLIAEDAIPDTVITVNLAGERLDQSVVDQLYSKNIADVFDLYGPSEDTTYSTYVRRKPNGVYSIGRPISNTQSYVLDETGMPVPRGAIGELHLGGAGVVRGYLNREELTKEKFIDNPFGEGKLYRTGDLVKYLRDGDLEFIGRADHQVKVRGFRIELGEIEHELSKLEEIRSAVVLAREDEPGIKRLVGYVALGSDSGGTENERQELKRKIKEVLSARLPEYMVPQVLVLMEEIPLTLNGKTDRKKLPAPETVEAAYLAPEGKTENALAEIWSGLLKIDVSLIGRNSNFFELGGNSLSSVQLVNLINSTLGVKVSIKDVFEFMDISALASQIDSGLDILELLELLHERQIKVLVENAKLKIDAPEGVMTDEILSLLKVNKVDLIDYLSSTERQDQSIGRTERTGDLPLSYAQQRLWFLDRMDSGSSHYNMPGALEVHGKFDLSAAEEAFQTIVARHETLRTVFTEVAGKEGAIQIIKEDVEVTLAVTDLRHLERDEQDVIVRNAVDADARLAFDLTRDPMLRMSYIWLSGESDEEAQRGVLLFNMHHIASDGWSIGVLVREFASLYESLVDNKPNPLEPLAIQYADYAVWQREWLKGDVLKKQLDYWQGQLEDLPPVHSLPLNNERPSFQTFNGAKHGFGINGEKLKKLKRLSMSEKSTLFMVLHAAFSWTISRYSGTNDIVIGTPVANRLQKELEPLIGFFVNTLVLRTKCSGGWSVSEYLKEIKKVNIDAQSNQDVPFEHLVDRINPARSTSYNAFFQIMFSMDTNEGEALSLPGVELLPLADEPGEVVSKFDLTLNAREEDGGLSLNFEYNTDLFEKELIEELSRSLVRVIEGLTSITDNSVLMSEIPVLGNEERKNLISGLNNTRKEHPRKKLIHQLFEEQVQSSPMNTAVVFKDKTLTYKELNESSNRVAHFLREKGAGPDQIVGLCVERSLEMMIGLMGILKAGAAYLPLDPNYPKDRLDYMIGDAGVSILLTDSVVTSEHKFENQITLALDKRSELKDYPVNNPSHSQSTESNAAYVIFTSGSTGNPKGVIVEHQSETNLLYWYLDEYGITDSDRVLVLSASSFDLTQKNLLAPLICGASVEFATARFFDVPEICDFIDRRKITFTNCAPSVFYPLVEDTGNLNKLSSLRCVLFGGEAIAFDRLRKWLATVSDSFELVNMYGPTECTDIACSYFVPLGVRNTGAPIGKPNDNVQLYVLDESENLAPRGVIGELYIGGAGVSRGYINNPQLNEQKFVPNTFSNLSDKMYRTGDLVKWSKEGNLEFVGRIDNQIKIRGHRVELGEVEATIQCIDGINQAVVIFDELAECLNAYIVPDKDSEIEVNEIASAMKQTLPAHMMPGGFAMLSSIPLTVHGKIDRRALPEVTNTVSEVEYVAPSNSTEECLTEIWQELLDIAGNISVNANFFELGGHSLLLTQMIHRTAEQLGVQLSVRSIFAAPTIRQIAAVIADGDASGIYEGLTRFDGVGPAPLSYAQYRVWFVEQLRDETNEHNIAVAARIRGVFDPSVLEESLNRMIERHEVLRTWIADEKGEPVQCIADSFKHSLNYEDVTALPEDQQRQKIKDLTHSQDTQAFDLGRAPLFSDLLVKTAEDEYLFHFNQHHIISDGWSQQLFYGELFDTYRLLSLGEEPNRGEIEFHYSDYSRWQRKWLDSENAAQQKRFWSEYLDGCRESLTLPMQKSEGNLDGTQGHHLSSLETGLQRELKALASKHKGSLFNVLHAAFALLIARLSGENDFNLGIPVTGRHIFGTQEMLGMFLNNLPVRHQISTEMSFSELLRSQIQNIEQVLSNQDIPFEQILELNGSDRNSETTPLFQILFNMLSVPENNIDIEGLGFEIEEQNTEDIETKFNLTLYVKDSTEGIDIACHFNESVFSNSQIEQMMSQYSQLLTQIVENAQKRGGDYSLNSEPNYVVHEKAISRFTNRDVTALFRDSADKTPSATAIKDEFGEWSYEQLRHASEVMSDRLSANGVGKGDVVTLLAARRPTLVIGILAALQIGATYSVVTPETPRERILQHLSIAGTSVVAFCENGNAYPTELVDEIGGLAKILEIDSDWNAYSDLDTKFESIAIEPELAACITFTSGSTGIPKGVVGSHLGLSGYLSWLPEHVGFAASDRFSLLSGLAHDPLQRDIFGALAVGGTICIPRENDFATFNLADWLNEEQITVVHATPAMADLISQQGVTELKHLKTVFLTGETLRKDTAQSLLKLNPALRILNCYGATETQRAATYFEISSIDELSNFEAAVVPASTHTPDTRLHIVNSEGMSCGVGEIGQICTESAHIAIGYLNDSETGARQFVDLKDGMRRYLTGDLGVYLNDDVIQCLGRSDSQVNIRGFRVELGEIEHHLTGFEEVRSAAVMFQNNAFLVGYVTAANEISDQQVLIENLKIGLSAKLPEYMIPSVIVVLEQMPLNENGKIDKPSLPVPELESFTTTYIAPESEIETLVCGMWSRLLKIPAEKISVNANFFELGGHSLLLLKLISEIRTEFVVEVSVKQLFDSKDLAELGSLIKSLLSRAKVATQLAGAGESEIEEVEF